MRFVILNSPMLGVPKTPEMSHYYITTAFPKARRCALCTLGSNVTFGNFLQIEESERKKHVFDTW